ncbi:MAG: LLM class flavin-dependent oxidoreductase [Microbacteriaceae bacterium]
MTSAPFLVGVTVRTLGAWPYAWRAEGAHRDPREDPAVLRELAVRADRAGADFLYFGDWLATSIEFERTDPYLLARLEPLAAAAHLSAVTERIGFVVTVNAGYVDAYSLARATASLDLLSGGRLGLAVTTSTDAATARNYGGRSLGTDFDRATATAELVEALHALWDSWDEDAFIADVASARLVDPGRVHAAGFTGQHHGAGGALNAVRPPQGHLPLFLSASGLRARDVAARYADAVFTNAVSLDEAARVGVETRRAAESYGRPAPAIVLPVLPVVGDSEEDAWERYDALVALVPLADAASADEGELPAERTVRGLARLVDVPLAGVLLDEPVPARLAQRFAPLGHALVRTTTERSGRTIGGARPITWRQLLVANLVRSRVLVGSAARVAEELERWHGDGALHGVSVLPATLDHGIRFLEEVLPLLEARGLRPATHDTLRGRLGLGAAPSIHARPLALR